MNLEEGQLQQLRLAIARADSAIADPRFATVLKRMQANGKIDWERRTRNVPPQHRADPTSWITGRFAAEGNFKEQQVNVRKFTKWWGGTNTGTVGETGFCRVDTSASTCGTDTNVWFVQQWAQSGDGYSWANNLVHERIHAFGQIHVTQYEEPNKCDVAYVAGNLAEAILRSRALGGPLPANNNLCADLVTEMRAERMMM